MNLTVHIPDEAVPALRAKASGVSLEAFAEQVLLSQIQDADIETADFDKEKVVRPLRAFGNYERECGLTCKACPSANSLTSGTGFDEGVCPRCIGVHALVLRG